MTLRYELSGYGVVERQAYVRWQEEIRVPEVVLE